MAEEDEGYQLGDEELYEEAQNFLTTVLPDTSLPAQERLDRGLRLSFTLESKINVSIHGVDAILTNYRITQGKIFLGIQTLVRETDRPWEAWAAEHLNFIPERTRQDYMQLAKATWAHAYSFLGKERLLLLVRATKNMVEIDETGQENEVEPEERIPRFLQKYGILFDPESGAEPEGQLAEFKNRIDAAIFTGKTTKYGLSVPFERILPLVQLGVKMDTKLIRDMALIQRNEGNIDTYLDRLRANLGREENLLDPGRRVESLPKLVARLNDVLAAFNEAPDLVNRLADRHVAALETIAEALRRLRPRS